MPRAILAASALLAFLAAPAALGSHNGPNCPPQPVHSYNFYFTNGNSRELLSHGISVADSNARPCWPGGGTIDFDGDYDSGTAGAFFGWGPWADDPTCGYDLHKHGPNVYVNDVVFGTNVWFQIGALDTGGPTMGTTTSGQTFCSTDGMITPTPGSPTYDPTDCLTAPTNIFLGVGSPVTCGAGGDGGFWVILLPGPNPPTVGIVAAY